MNHPPGPRVKSTILSTFQHLDRTSCFVIARRPCRRSNLPCFQVIALPLHGSLLWSAIAAMTISNKLLSKYFLLLLSLLLLVLSVGAGFAAPPLPVPVSGWSEPPRAIASLSVERFSAAEGLPGRYPRALARDDRGRVWAAFMSERNIGEWLGLAFLDASATVRIWQAGTASGLRSDHVTRVRFAPGLGLLAATDHGLHRFDEGADRFEAIGPDLPLTHLGITADGAIWAVSEKDSGFRSEILRFLPAGASCETRRWPAPATVHRPLGIFPVGPARVSVVFQNGILDLDGKRCRSAPLRTSPLWRKAVRDPDGPIPEIWIQAADAGADGTLFLIGHTRRLAARRPDGRWETLAEGHFCDVLAGAASGEAFVTDFTGRLFRAADGRFEELHRRPASQFRRLFSDARQRLWMVDAPPRRAETLLRFSPPFPGGPEAALSLGDDQGCLSCGILEQLDDGAGGLWLSTNEGLWHVR